PSVTDANKQLAKGRGFVGGKMIRLSTLQHGRLAGSCHKYEEHPGAYQLPRFDSRMHLHIPDGDQGARRHTREDKAH
ncbi:hypothetical protein, partial [Klebsiella pneumoniae]